MGRCYPAGVNACQVGEKGAGEGEDRTVFYCHLWHNRLLISARLGMRIGMVLGFRVMSTDHGVGEEGGGSGWGFVFQVPSTDA